VPDPDRRVGGLRAPAPRSRGSAGRRLRDPVHFRPGAHRIGKARGQLPAGDFAPRFGHVGLAAHAGGRRGGGRHPRARGARPAAKRGRASGIVVAPGDRRGGLRDRAAASVRAARYRRGARRLQAARRDGARLRRPLSLPGRRVSARVQGRRLREAHSGRVPDSPRDIRPALHRLVDAGEVPAHARRAAPDGGGDPQSVGEGRLQPADPAVDDSHRRRSRAVRADALPLGQLGSHHREGRGRAELASAQDRRRAAQPREAPRDPARGTHHLPRFGAHGGCGPGGSRIAG